VSPGGRRVFAAALAAGAAAACLAIGLMACRRCRPDAASVSGRKAGAAAAAEEAFLLSHDQVMGSGFNAKAFFPAAREKEARAALSAALQAALDLEKKISKYDPASEVRRSWDLRAGERLAVSAETFRALELSRDLWKRSGGAFDCTVQPLIDLYKFTGKEERLPTDAEVAAARAKVGSDRLLLEPDGRTVALGAPGMKVDLGAVGQGFGADVACEALRKAGASGALVELGGEVRAAGRKPDGSPWKVAVVHPRATGKTMTVAELDGNAVSTSGDYEKYFLTTEGAAPASVDSRLTTKPRQRRASHILDPRTGKPLVGGAVSVTVIAPECSLADGLATAVSVLGPVEGMKLVESYRAEGRAVEVLIIEEAADGKLVPHLSPGLKGRLRVDLEVPAGADGAAD